MATIRWCPIFPKWDIYQPLLKLQQTNSTSCIQALNSETRQFEFDGAEMPNLMFSHVGSLGVALGRTATSTRDDNFAKVCIQNFVQEHYGAESPCTQTTLAVKINIRSSVVHLASGEAGVLFCVMTHFVKSQATDSIIVITMSLRLTIRS